MLQQKELIFFLFLVAVSLVVLVAIIYVELGQRRIPVQFAKRVVGRRMYGGQSTYIPLKVNQSGVIPIIFASSLLLLPVLITNLLGNSTEGWRRSLTQFINKWVVNQTDPIHMLIYGLVIVGFAYFYNAIAFDPAKQADQLRKQGGFIPGIRRWSTVSKTQQYVALLRRLRRRIARSRGRTSGASTSTRSSSCRPGVPTLIHMLGDARWFVARNAAELLGEMQAREAEPQLTELLRHSDDRVRRAATSALMRLGTSRAMQAIQDALQGRRAGDAHAGRRGARDAEGREDRRRRWCARSRTRRTRRCRRRSSSRSASSRRRTPCSGCSRRSSRSAGCSRRRRRRTASRRCRDWRGAHAEATEALKGLQSDKDEEVREAATFAPRSASPVSPRRRSSPRPEPLAQRAANSASGALSRARRSVSAPSGPSRR